MRPSPAAAAFRTVLDERFEDNRRGWPDDAESTARLAEDGYHLFAREPGQFVAVGVPLAGEFRNVVVTATFRKVGGPPGGSTSRTAG